MAIPNTTPTPNILFNGEMKKMKDTELRVVMIVTRATFGWVIDKKNGLRKEEDWISLSQMVSKSGKSARAINAAIKTCVEKKWIEARTEEGFLLDTAEKRMKHGKKIFYRLGYKFLKHTPAKSAQVDPRKKRQGTPANTDTRPPQKVRATKESITKETLTKEPAHGNSLNGEKPKTDGRQNNRLAEKPYSKVEWLLELTDDDVAWYQERFPGITNMEVKDAARDGYYWKKDKGVEGKDNRSFLRNWLARSRDNKKTQSSGVLYEE